MKPDEEYKLSEVETEEAGKKWKEFCKVYFKFEITSKKMPTFADSDYEIFVNGEFNHFLEVKKRRNTLNHYDQTKIPLRKHAVAEHWFKEKGYKTFFLAIFTDCIGVVPIYKEPDAVKKMIARYDRGNDEDTYALYDVSKIKKICGQNLK